MSNTNLCTLPSELIKEISRYLSFSDIWYFGTCSKSTRIISFQLIRSIYKIDLIQPRIIDPYAHLIHAAVAYLNRHGTFNCITQYSILQSVANHMSIAIYDRTPNQSGRTASLDFLLDKTLNILLFHCLNDITLLNQLQEEDQGAQKNNKKRASKEYIYLISEKLNGILDMLAQEPQRQQPTTTDGTSTSRPKQDLYTTQPTGVLMIDFLVVFYQTLTIVFHGEPVNTLYHRLLNRHLVLLFGKIKKTYQIHHITLSSYQNGHSLQHYSAPNNPIHTEFHLFIKFVCVLSTVSSPELLTTRDMDDLAFYHISYFFMTQPSDVSYSTKGGLKIIVGRTHENLSIINTVTHSKTPAIEYQWKLWLEETHLRLSMLLDLVKTVIEKNYASNEPPGIEHLIRMLQEAVAAVTLTNDQDVS